MNAVLALARNGYLGEHAKRQLHHVQPQKKGESCDFPMCGTCQYAKQTKQPIGVTRAAGNDAEQHKILSKDITQPGQRISVDQFEVVKKGRRFRGFGRSSDKDQYTCGTIFVDHATGLIKAYYQTSLSADDTIVSKIQFEREARLSGVTIQEYSCDNGIFTSSRFQSHLD